MKICDFGMARRFSNPHGDYTQHVVTLIYRAPELLLNPQEDMRFPPTRKISYDSKVDMWSVGWVLTRSFDADVCFTSLSLGRRLCS